MTAGAATGSIASVGAVVDGDADDEDDDEEEDVGVTLAAEASSGFEAMTPRVMAPTCANSSGDGFASGFGFVSNVSMFLIICCISC